LIFTLLNTFLDNFVRVRIPLKLDDTRMKDALESATSLPEPIAMPTSAAESAWRAI
jgi:hypothetical protein